MFSYLYYRIHSTYKYKWNNKIPSVYAICGISLLQFFNLSCLLFLSFFYSETHLYINKLYGVVFIIGLLILNYYRFNVYSSFEKLEKKWIHEVKSRKIMKGIFIVIYIIFSVLLFLILANYLGEINRNLLP